MYFFFLLDSAFQLIAETPFAGFRFRSAPAFGRFVPAPPYAEGSKNLGLSQNGVDRETKAKGLLSLFLYPYATSLIH